MEVTMKNAKSFIGTIITVILAIFLLNPQWLPVSAETKESMLELRKQYFLIQRSGKITAAHILTLILAICLLWLISFVFRLAIQYFAKKSLRSQTIANMLAGAFHYLIVIIGIVWGLAILGVNTTAVLAGVGIIGLILGFGAQSLIEDIITGAFIIFEGQYVNGDIIILDDFRGTVRNIGVRTTTIEDAGGNLKVVNNSDIRNFQNRSRINSLVIIICAVAYDTDLRRLEKVMEKELPGSRKNHPVLYLTDIRYMGVEELADSGINLKFSVQADEEKFFQAKRALNRDVKLLLDANGFEIPFPQVVVHKGD